MQVVADSERPHAIPFTSASGPSQPYGQRCALESPPPAPLHSCSTAMQQQQQQHSNAFEYSFYVYILYRSLLSFMVRTRCARRIVFLLLYCILDYISALSV